MTADELNSFYANLLIIQYKGQPKAVATIKAFINEAIGGPLTLFPAVRDIWDLENAVGKQLDIIGRIHGLTRYIVGVDTTKTFFGMPQASIAVPDDPNNFYGFIAYADIPVGGYPNTAWYWFTYPDLAVVSGEMDDNTFQRWIKYIILLRSSDCSIENIDWIFTPAKTRLAHDGTYKTADDWFAPSIHLWGDIAVPVYVTDNQDMTVTYTIDATKTGPGLDNVMLISAIKTLSAFPKPSGAQLIIVG